jgi:hypothetical protein
LGSEALLGRIALRWITSALRLGVTLRGSLLGVALRGIALRRGLTLWWVSLRAEAALWRRPTLRRVAIGRTLGHGLI